MQCTISPSRRFLQFRCPFIELSRWILSKMTNDFPASLPIKAAIRRRARRYCALQQSGRRVIGAISNACQLPVTGSPRSPGMGHPQRPCSPLSRAAVERSAGMAVEIRYRGGYGSRYPLPPAFPAQYETRTAPAGENAGPGTLILQRHAGGPVERKRDPRQLPAGRYASLRDHRLPLRAPSVR